MSYIKVNQKAYTLIADGMIENIRANVIDLVDRDKVLFDARFRKPLTVRQTIDSLFKAISLSRKYIKSNCAMTYKSDKYDFTLNKLEHELRSYYIAYAVANPSKQTARQKELLASIKEKKDALENVNPNKTSILNF